MVNDFHLWWTVITIVVVMGAIQGTCAYLILLERKISAWIQDRLGPNRVGPGGLLQPIADGLKFLLKEDVIPGHVDRMFYLLAPAIAIITATFAFAVVPFGATTAPPTGPVLAALPENASHAEREVHEAARRVYERAYHEPPADASNMPALSVPASTSPEMRQRIDQQIKSYQEGYRDFARYHEELRGYERTYQFVIAPHLDIGILLVFAVSSLAVYGIILGGWSSNNKYSLLGAMRSSAQFISYEIPMGLSVLGLVLLSGSLNLEKIINQQAGGVWWICFQPLAFLLFLTSIFAECNRLPFDLPEAEQELVGGYHTEYSALKFALFFLGEYTHMITTSFLAVVLFFGGWHLPWIAPLHTGPEPPGIGEDVVKVIIFGVKMSLFIVFYMLVRWTLPRFRFDQLMALAWKVLIPLALVNLVCVLVVEQLIHVYGFAQGWRWLLPPLSLLLLVLAGLVALYRPVSPRRSIVVTRGHERVEITV